MRGTAEEESLSCCPCSGNLGTDSLQSSSLMGLNALTLCLLMLGAACLCSCAQKLPLLL